MFYAELTHTSCDRTLHAKQIRDSWVWRDFISKVRKLQKAGQNFPYLLLLSAFSPKLKKKGTHCVLFMVQHTKSTFRRLWPSVENHLNSLCKQVRLADRHTSWCEEMWVWLMCPKLSCADCSPAPVKRVACHQAQKAASCCSPAFTAAWHFTANLLQTLLLLPQKTKVAPAWTWINLAGTPSPKWKPYSW